MQNAEVENWLRANGFAQAVGRVPARVESPSDLATLAQPELAALLGDAALAARIIQTASAQFGMADRHGQDFDSEAARAAARAARRAERLRKVGGGYDTNENAAPTTVALAPLQSTPLPPAVRPAAEPGQSQSPAAAPKADQPMAPAAAPKVERAQAPEKEQAIAEPTAAEVLRLDGAGPTATRPTPAASPQPGFERPQLPRPVSGLTEPPPAQSNKQVLAVGVICAVVAAVGGALYLGSKEAPPQLPAAATADPPATPDPARPAEPLTASPSPQSAGSAAGAAPSPQAPAAPAAPAPAPVEQGASPPGVVVPVVTHPLAELAAGNALTTLLSTNGITEPAGLWRLDMAACARAIELREAHSDVRPGLDQRVGKNPETGKWDTVLVFEGGRLITVGQYSSGCASVLSAARTVLGAPESADLPKGGVLLEWGVPGGHLLAYVAVDVQENTEWWLHDPSAFHAKQAAERTLYQAYSYNDHASAVAKPKDAPGSALAEAADAYAKALELVPNYGRCRLRLCKVQTRLRDYQAALASCGSAATSQIPEVATGASKQIKAIEKAQAEGVPP